MKERDKTTKKNEREFFLAEKKTNDMYHHTLCLVVFTSLVSSIILSFTEHTNTRTYKYTHS